MSDQLVQAERKHAFHALLDDTHADPQPTITTYAPHGIRKTILAFVFLVLLPFYASLPAMIFQRVVAGVWLNTWGLFVIAAAFTALMVLLLFELIYALRARIELGAKTLELVLPQGSPGSIPMLNYRAHTIAYDDFDVIERRSEVYGGSLAPVLMQSTWVRLKDHRRILIGAVNSKSTDHVFPFGQIAEQIAERAGVEIVDLGAVKRPVKDAIVGLMAHETQGAMLSREEMEELNARHTNVVVALVCVFVFVLGLGIASDMLNGSTDLGERRPNVGISSLFGG